MSRRPPVTAADLHPRPREVRLGEETCSLPVPVPIVAAGDPRPDRIAGELAGTLSRSGLPAQRREEGSQPSIRLAVAPGAAPPQGYRLEVRPSGISIVGGDEAGLFYGGVTLCQWIRLHQESPASPVLPLPCLEVGDHPVFRHRGVLLDISRDKVPTMETLYALVERLAAWKVNELQLYTEHTFAYRGHEVVWRGASPVTPGEAERLDAFCRERFIELVPNQNSFGHLHRWLVHEPYRRLAECPEGVEHPWSRVPEPFGLCPLDPGALDLLADLYDQLLPCFASRRCNVGLDETLDLGRCRSARACAERGRHRVYLDFLGEVHRLLAERGHRMQFWGDIALEAPELIGELPADATALAWGYEADHPWEEVEHFAGAGLEFYVCPGTSSWSSFGGRCSNALANIGTAAAGGERAGAGGMLVTDWGDHGHLQPLPVSDPGLLAGAGCAWSGAAGALDAPGLQRSLDLHAFEDRSGIAGGVAWDLGELYRVAAPPSRNGSALFRLVVFPERPLSHPSLRGLTREGLEAAAGAAEEAASRLPSARMERRDGALVVRELTWVAAALRLAARLGLARLEAGGDAPIEALPAAIRRELAADLSGLREGHRQIWLARNRPGGREDSAARLAPLGRLLAG